MKKNVVFESKGFCNMIIAAMKPTNQLQKQ